MERGKEWKTKGGKRKLGQKWMERIEEREGEKEKREGREGRERRERRKTKTKECEEQETCQRISIFGHKINWTEGGGREIEEQEEEAERGRRGERGGAGTDEREAEETK